MLNCFKTIEAFNQQSTIAKKIKKCKRNFKSSNLNSIPKNNFPKKKKWVLYFVHTM